MSDTVTDVTTSPHTSYTSSKPAVATVDDNGTIHAVSAGSCHVTARYSSGGVVAHKSVAVASSAPHGGTGTTGGEGGGSGDPTPNGGTNFADGLIDFQIDAPTTVTAVRIYLRPEAAGTRGGGLIGFIPVGSAWNTHLPDLPSLWLGHAVIPPGCPTGWNEFVLDQPVVLLPGASAGNALVVTAAVVGDPGPRPEIVDISSTRSGDACAWTQPGGITTFQMVVRNNNYFNSKVWFAFTFAFIIGHSFPSHVVGSVEGEAALTAGKPQAQLFTVNAETTVTKVAVVRPHPPFLPVDTDLGCPIGIAPVFSNTDTVPWLGKGLIAAGSTADDGWCTVTLDSPVTLHLGQFYSLVCTATSALSGAAEFMECFGVVASAYEVVYCGLDADGDLVWDYDSELGETTAVRMAFRLITS